MALLASYHDFLDRANELGVISFSRLLPGFPSLEGETSPYPWHSDDPEADPWKWKDRAAQEKELAFGCLLGGHKGFISRRMYPLFYAACHPRETLEDQWTAGRLNQLTWRLWKLFSTKEILSTDEIRRGLGVSKNRGAGLVDSRIVELERTFFITVAGNRRKVNQAGFPYGWPSNLYAKVTHWAPPDWLAGWASLQPEDAAEQILDVGEAISVGVDREALRKVLRL